MDAHIPTVSKKAAMSPLFPQGTSGYTSPPLPTPSGGSPHNAVVQPIDHSGIQLRPVEGPDLEVFFHNEQDPTALHMAAFTPENPGDRDRFRQRWERILADPGITVRTIVHRGEVVGSVLSYPNSGEVEVSYWIGREHWGQGIATAALSRFLLELDQRPLVARVAADNHASRRVLEKCGFRVVGKARGYASARARVIDELVLVLD